MASKVWAAPQRVSPGEGRLWAWYVGIGAGLMLLGMAASANLVLATIATVFVIAAAMGGGGILMLVHTVAMRSWGWATLWSVCGLLYLGAAASILHTPLFAAQLLTFWLMATFAISGLARFMLGVLRHGRGWGWVMASGGVSLAAGVVIALGWPADSLWVLGLIMAVDLLLQGISLVMTGLALRPGKGQ